MKTVTTAYGLRLTKTCFYCKHYGVKISKWCKKFTKEAVHNGSCEAWEMNEKYNFVKEPRKAEKKEEKVYYSIQECANDYYKKNKLNIIKYCKR